MPNTKHMQPVHSARELIRMEYGSSKNFMTPNVIERRKNGRHRAIEIASGTGFNQEPIYGVSIVDHFPQNDTTTRRRDLSQCFQSRGAALLYANKLQMRTVYPVLSRGAVQAGSASFKVGHLTATERELTEVFGEPDRKRTGKVRVSWEFEGQNGHYVHVYRYKGQKADHWSIGGYSSYAVVLVRAYLWGMGFGVSWRLYDESQVAA